MAKEKAEEKKVDSKSILSSILKEHKSEHYNFHERVDWRVSTGSLLLDAATGGVKPSMWRLCGQNNCGKTPQMLEIVRNILTNVPNSKGLWVLAEGRGLSEENISRCGLKFVYDEAEWEVGTVFVLETNIFELFVKVVKDLVLNNPEGIRYAFVVDSVDGLILRDDATKEIDGNNKVAGVPALSKKMMQSLSLGMFKYGHWMGLISQKTSEIKIDPYAKTVNRGGQFSGGNALLHGSDIIMEYEPSFNGDFILNNASGKMNDGKSKPIGQHVKVNMVKVNLEAAKKTIVTYPIKYARKPSGIWTEMEVGQMVLGWGLAKVAGAGWITFDPVLQEEAQTAGVTLPEKLQGQANLFKLLESDKGIYDFLYKKVANSLP